MDGSREGAEWLHNRRILNRLLLNGNLNWMDVHIENCTKRLVDQWRSRTAEVETTVNVTDEMLETSCGKRSYEVPQLEQQLYRWSIEGKRGVFVSMIEVWLLKIFQSITVIFQVKPLYIHYIHYIYVKKIFELEMFIY